MPKVQLKTAGIVLDGDKLTDILTARKTFEEVVEYAKDLYPQYVILGTEPAIEIRVVMNLEVDNGEADVETATWEESTPEGTSRKRRWNSDRPASVI
jgi:hypothetical protein